MAYVKPSIPSFLNPRGHFTYTNLTHAYDMFASKITKVIPYKHFLNTVLQLLNQYSTQELFHPALLCNFLSTEVKEGHTPSPALCKFFHTLYLKSIPLDYMD